MATVAKAMACPESGLEVRDRMWLKITIANAFIGTSVKAQTLFPLSVCMHIFFFSSVLALNYNLSATKMTNCMNKIIIYVFIIKWTVQWQRKSYNFNNRSTIHYLFNFTLKHRWISASDLFQWFSMEMCLFQELIRQCEWHCISAKGVGEITFIDDTMNAKVRIVTWPSLKNQNKTFRVF